MSKVITITSGKGGTGKTVFTTNLGAVLADKGFKVLMIDLDLGLRNLDLCMGMENRIVYDLGDVLLGMCKIKQAIIKDKRFESLYMMAAPQCKKDSDYTEEQIVELCDKLREDFDYILIDAPAGTEMGFKLSVAPADQLIILTTPEYTAIRDADVVDRLLTEMGKENVVYVLNKVKVDLIKAGLMPTLTELTTNMRMELIGIIQYDENIQIASNRGIPIVMKPGTYIRANFESIADKVK